MNGVRCLLVAFALVIETFRPGVLTRFAPSSLTSYSSNAPHTTWAPNGAGRTDYYNNGHYEINNLGPDGLAAGAYFYRSNNKNRVAFESCNKAVGDSCGHNLPKDFAGPLCMETGVGKYGQPAEDYKYGKEDCFVVQSLK